MKSSYDAIEMIKLFSFHSSLLLIRSWNVYIYNKWLEFSTKVYYISFIKKKKKKKKLKNKQ